MWSFEVIWLKSFEPVMSFVLIVCELLGWYHAHLIKSCVGNPWVTSTKSHGTQRRGDACLLLDQMLTRMLRPNVISHFGPAAGSFFCFFFLTGGVKTKVLIILGVRFFQGKKQMRSKSKAIVQQLVPVKQTLDGSRHWLSSKQCWRLKLIRMLSATAPLSVACRFFSIFFEISFQRDAATVV